MRVLNSNLKSVHNLMYMFCAAFKVYFLFIIIKVRVEWIIVAGGLNKNCVSTFKFFRHGFKGKLIEIKNMH